MSKTNNCPRRMEDMSPFKYEELLDEWRDDGTCSYCGSMNPDEFMRAAKSGIKLTPTDKSYKVYIGGEKFYFQHLSTEQKQEFIQLLNENMVSLDYPGHFYVLPFFCKPIEKDKSE